jgi:hypothetical protein
VTVERRAGEEDEKPARRSVGASGLLDGLDAEGDRDLVADHRAPGLHRELDVDTEVFAVQHDRGFVAGDLAVSLTGADSVELQVEADRLGDSP